MTRKILVGMLLLGALFIFGLATFYVENWQFYLGKTYRLVAHFEEALTLDEGDLVRVTGVPAGTVQELKIDTKSAAARPVQAVLLIQEGFDIRSDDTATIRISSFFGGNYVSIERGNPTASVLQDGEEIRKTAVSAGVTEIVEEAKGTLTDIREAVSDVTNITGQLTEGKGTLGRLLVEEELVDKLQAAIDQATGAIEGLKTASDRLQKGEGALGRLLMDDTLAADLERFSEDAQQVAENLKSLTTDLTEGRGTVGKLFADEKLYDDLRESASQIREVASLASQGEGVLARLLDDAELSENVRTFAADARQVAANMRDISDQMKEGDGSLTTSLENLNEITKALAEGEGTLGKLIKDDSAYQQLSGLLDAVQGIVDAYREQSPVISLAGAVFGAF